MRLLSFLLLFLVCASCGGTVMPLYEEQRAIALSEPPPAPANWRADGRIAISERMLQTLLGEAVQGAQRDSEKATLRGPGLSATPNASLKSLSLEKGDCVECVALDVSFAGNLDWKLLTKTGRSPYTATASIEGKLVIDKDKTGWRTRLQLNDVKDLALSLNGWTRSLQTAVSTPLERWLKDQITEAIPDIPLAELDAKRIPLRAARVRPADKALAVEFLAGEEPQATLSAVKLRKGWSVNLSNAALIDIARSKSFREGPDAHGVVVTPVRFDVNREAFELDIRIWRLNGSGWWRDYRVNGELSIKPGAIKLTTQDVVETGQSPGAAFVDPLAALGETLIIRAIEDAITTSLPSTKSMDFGDKSLKVSVQTIGGGAGFLRIGGVTTLR